MKYCKLRIAWSVAWGIACLMLVVLWVRSYWKFDVVEGTIGKTTAFRALLVSGRACVTFFPNNYMPWNVEAHDIPEPWSLGLPAFPVYGKLKNLGPYIIFPHALAAYFAVVMAGVSWVKWSTKFGLRAILIATTLISVALGIIAISH